jgi:trimethyllysine dioxygenase
MQLSAAWCRALLHPGCCLAVPFPPPPHTPFPSPAPHPTPFPTPPCIAQVFELDSEGDVVSFTFNNEDRSTELLSLDAIPEYYRHLHVLMGVVSDPSLQVWLYLTPGTTIFMNNTRILHGRSEFKARTGRRLVGCYMNNEEFKSRLRALARKLEPSSFYDVS